MQQNSHNTEQDPKQRKPPKNTNTLQKYGAMAGNLSREGISGKTFNLTPFIHKNLITKKDSWYNKIQEITFKEITIEETTDNEDRETTKGITWEKAHIKVTAHKELTNKVIIRENSRDNKDRPGPTTTG